MQTFQYADRLKALPKQFFAKLVTDVNHYVQTGKDVINLGQGNPDLPTPEHIIRSLQTAVTNPQFHKYSPFRGFSFLKEAIATYYQREYHVSLDPETEVAILFGGKVGLVEIAQCFLNPGDVALVPDPGYPDYWSGIAMSGAQMEMMPLLAENQFLPDYHHISQEILEQAKLIFLNYPNNPTAAVATPEFFAETVKLARKNSICVVHDFAYGAIGFDGQKPLSFLQTPGAKEIGIEIYTLSKTYNMAGWRVGFALGNRSVIQAIELLQDHFYVSLFGAVQQAAATALLESQNCVKELVQTYENRRNTFISGLTQIGWKVPQPKGSFFCWLPVPSGYTSTSFAAKLLDQAHIAVAPGIGFGKAGDGYVRVGLLTDEKRLEEAVYRLDQLALFH
ncbi:pyridoxal phosphate-dependent aminotransferase [Shimazuella sp. AN120528]|uniref:pyridoxal phosphate-dependent aminotransferase n=1 Tax=Shimazuella soli TaxID=1892854 RepID=UPI001F0E23A5|nr:pyridoxal phosphate-dependent aminotransferase [Shimazuella soli]MCH5583990.1 pyridoxal phosphate-dependent aminotransferase [Shimazuella soli]